MPYHNVRVAQGKQHFICLKVSERIDSTRVRGISAESNIAYQILVGENGQAMLTKRHERYLRIPCIECPFKYSIEAFHPKLFFVPFCTQV
jgi:hypothetical protein